MAQTCPRCGMTKDDFIAIDTSTRAALEEAGESGLPPQVCGSCYEGLTAVASQGLKLRMERDVREKNKMVMWKNRVHLIKNARGLMAQKAYSEAAVQYEKYLRVLEVVYSLKKGELSPAVFNNSTRSKELTVVASVYWDLMRIYDTNPRYTDRMESSSRKLAEFLPFSQIYPDVMKKAESFVRSAKNPGVVRNFLRATKSSRGPCFVADAAFADEPFAREPQLLRRFRDERLRQTPRGRALVGWYYRVSPPLARQIARRPWLARVARWFLAQLAKTLVFPPRNG